MKNSSSRALIFYFLMTLILLDFGNSLRKLSYNPNLNDYSNPVFSIIHTTNTGSAFGFFEDKTFALAIFGIIALIFITYYVYNQDQNTF